MSLCAAIHRVVATAEGHSDSNIIRATSRDARDTRHVAYCGGTFRINTLTVSVISYF